jgi:hypothetical protein
MPILATELGADGDTHPCTTKDVMNPAVVAVSVAIPLVVLALVHVFWAIGGDAGLGAAVPSRADGVALVRPGLVPTLIVAVGLVGVALVVLVRVRLVPGIGSPALYRWASWAAGAAFALRTIGEFRYVGLFKRVRGTRFAAWDNAVYTPLCAMLSAAILYLAAI